MQTMSRLLYLFQNLLLNFRGMDDDNVYIIINYQ